MSASNITIEMLVTLANMINNGGTGNFSCVSTDMDVRTAWAAMDTLEEEGYIEFPDDGATGRITQKGIDVYGLASFAYSLDVKCAA